MAFSTAAVQAMAAGTKTATIGLDGFLSVNLAPNQGAYPVGSATRWWYHRNDGTVSGEYWMVLATTAQPFQRFGRSLHQLRMTVQPVSKSVCRHIDCRDYRMTTFG